LADVPARAWMMSPKKTNATTSRNRYAWPYMFCHSF
jgi:hypothetical protein